MEEGALLLHCYEAPHYPGSYLPKDRLLLVVRAAPMDATTFAESFMGNALFTC